MQVLKSSKFELFWQVEIEIFRLQGSKSNSNFFFIIYSFQEPQMTNSKGMFPSLFSYCFNQSNKKTKTLFINVYKQPNFFNTSLLVCVNWIPTMRARVYIRVKRHVKQKILLLHLLNLCWTMLLTRCCCWRTRTL